MLRNMLTTYLNSSAIRFDRDSDGTEKSETDKIRDSIEVTEVKAEAEEDDEQSGNSENDKETDKEKKDEESDNEKEVEKEEETEDEKIAREADEAASTTNKTQRQIQRMQKRIDQLTAKTKSTEDEKAELLKLLNAKKEDGDLVLTEDEVERRAELRAAEIAHKKEFERSVTRLANGARKLDKQFDKNIKSATEEIGLLPQKMIEILDDIDNGADVLVYLSKNVDEYEDIYDLGESRMTRALDRIAEKLKPKAKPVSNAPKPNEPLGGRTPNNVLNDKMSDDEWIRKRNEELRAKRR